MIVYLFTLLTGVVIFFAAIIHLNQSLLNFLDFVAFVLVTGGTIAVTISIMPWEYRNDILFSLKLIFKKENRRYQKLLKTCFAVMQDVSTLQLLEKDEEISSKILRDGCDLMSLGFSEERLEHILREKTYQSVKRLTKIANALKSIAKYPPAFGLMGTVLGLINVMRGITQGVDVKQTGLEMAIALLATMYGLVTANLIVNPAAENLMKKIEEEEEYAEIAIQAILLIAKKATELESQEILNAYVPDEQKYNQLYLGSQSGDSAA